MISRAFIQMARAEATALGVPDLPVVVIPHPFADLEPREVDAVAERIAPVVAKALTARGSEVVPEYRDPVLAAV